MNPTSNVQQPEDIKPPFSVGEEFMQWAEKYWDLPGKFAIDNDRHPDRESCPYLHIRPGFVRKINDIIAKRLND